MKKLWEKSSAQYPSHSCMLCPSLQLCGVAESVELRPLIRWAVDNPVAGRQNSSKAPDRLLVSTRICLRSYAHRRAVVRPHHSVRGRLHWGPIAPRLCRALSWGSQTRGITVTERLFQLDPGRLGHGKRRLNTPAQERTAKCCFGKLRSAR